MADQKAILFYFVFFPAFFDLSVITVIDVAIVIAIATLSVGSAKLTYAFIADRAGSLLSPQVHRWINVVAAAVLGSVGIFLIVKP